MPSPLRPDFTAYRSEELSSSDEEDDEYTYSFEEDDKPLQSKKKRTSLSTNRKGLPRPVDRRIVEFVLSPERYDGFAQLCNEDHSVFGEPNSLQREKVKQRHQYLQDPERHGRLVDLELRRNARHRRIPFEPIQ